MLISNQDYLTPTGTGLAPEQVTLARRHSYGLLSALFLDGVTAVTLPIVQSIPELAETLPAAFDADEAAAVHQALFGFNIFPYESFFLGTDGLIGGPHTDGVVRSYRAAGFQEASSAASPDHIGHELAFTAYLLNKETTSGDTAVFLANHLLRWLPPFVLATARQGRPFYAALANLTLGLAADHFRECRQRQRQGRLTGGFLLPDPPALLKDEKTSLKDIGRYLTMPAYSGVYLGREDVARLARPLALPRGFGGRDQMLTNLMRTAVQYDQLPAVITAAHDLCMEWQNEYDRLAENYPEISDYVNVWRERAGETAVLLTRMAAQIPTN